MSKLESILTGISMIYIMFFMAAVESIIQNSIWICHVIVIIAMGYLLHISKKYYN